jgi:uncharacterized coiled-coil DUF342 family protein
MNSSLYPVPAEESALEPLVQPFLQDEVAKDALEPNCIFAIVLLGNDDDIRDVETATQEFISNSDERIQVAAELDQLQVTTLDERRLDTFATSLLYNLLELDQTAPIPETISRDDIADEGVRKIDYYIEKLNEYFATRIEQQTDEFQENLKTLFPVTLGDQSSTELFDMFENRLTASQNARVDYLLLARAASEERDRCLRFFETARDRGLDSKKYLGPISGGGGGYTRIIEYGYDQRQNDFRSEFTTAIQKAEEADTLNLRTKLNRLSPRADLETIYMQEPGLLRVLSNQYDGTGSDLADLLVRMVDAIQVIQDEEDKINVEYKQAKESLDETIDQLNSVYDRIEDHSSEYPSGKIQHDSSVVGDLREFCRVADRISQPTAKFVLGYDREGRSSLYSTLQENIDDRRQELESRETDLGEHTNRLQSLADRTKTKIDDIDSAYVAIEASSVNVDLPPKDDVKDTVEERCETVLEDVKSELPGLDFSNEADNIRDIQDEWDEMLTDARQDIDEVFQVVDQLERLAGEIDELETERESRRTQLRSLSEHMEVNDE